MQQCVVQTGNWCEVEQKKEQQKRAGISQNTIRHRKRIRNKVQDNNHDKFGTKQQAGSQGIQKQTVKNISGTYSCNIEQIGKLTEYP